MVVTESGMTIEVNPEHSEKAYSPILVTESGITVEIKHASRYLVFLKRTR